MTVERKLGEVEDHIRTDEELAESVTYWQDVLELRHWSIDSKFVRRRELNPDRTANVFYAATKGWATIDVIHPDDRERNGFIDNCAEVSVIHEMLHLLYWFVDFPPNSLEEMLFERSLNATARALWIQHRYASQEAEVAEKTRSFFVDGPASLEGDGECHDLTS